MRVIEEKGRAKGAERLFEERLIKNFPNLRKTLIYASKKFTELEIQ